MFHVNPETGNAGPCRAHIACPFGSAEEHFATKQEAETYFEASMAMQTLVTHQKKRSPQETFTTAQGDLKAALASGEGVNEARAEWERASIEFAATPEGAVHFQGLASTAAPGSQAQALYQHFTAEGNRLRVARMGAEDLTAILAATPAEPLATPLPAPVRWAEVDRRARTHMGTYVFDIQEYQERVDRFMADPASATSSELEGLGPAISVYSDFRYSPPVRNEDGTYIMSQEAWKPIAEESYAYGLEIANRAMAHPQATKALFERVMKEYGPTAALTHPACPDAVKVDHIAEQKGQVSESLLPMYRDLSYSSNRVALYLAAADTETLHREEAFHKVTVAGMETFEEKDRLWMATNLDKFPTSEGTVDTLRHSLRAWALGSADQAEREKLLALVGDRVPAPGEEGKKGWFRRE